MTTDNVPHAPTPELDEAFRRLGSAFADFWEQVTVRMRAEQPEMVQQLGALLLDGGGVRCIIDPGTLSVSFESLAPDGTLIGRFYTMLGRERGVSLDMMH